MVIHDRKIDRDAMATGHGVAELLNEKALAEIDALGQELYRQESPWPSSVCSANAKPGPGTAPTARPPEADLAALESFAAGTRASLESLANPDTPPWAGVARHGEAERVREKRGIEQRGILDQNAWLQLFAS